MGIGPFVAVNCPVQGFARPSLSTGPFGKVSHPIQLAEPRCAERACFPVELKAFL
jgi:hypothetical protein